jgi:hypothetical protein
MAIRDVILSKAREMISVSLQTVYLRADLLNLYLKLKQGTKVPERITPKYFLTLLLKEN